MFAFHCIFKTQFFQKIARIFWKGTICAVLSLLALQNLATLPLGPKSISEGPPDSSCKNHGMQGVWKVALKNISCLALLTNVQVANYDFFLSLITLRYIKIFVYKRQIE